MIHTGSVVEYIHTIRWKRNCSKFKHSKQDDSDDNMVQDDGGRKNENLCSKTKPSAAAPRLLLFYTTP
jgi:hypothetical protein